MIGLASRPPKSRSRASATVRALWPSGITEESIGVHTARSAGSASSSISAPVASATGSGRRITACASRYQPPRLVRRGLTASFSPQSANVAGAITSEAAPATSATTAPAMPIDFRKPSGKTVSVISAAATVTALKIDGPARRCASSCGSRPGSPWPAPRDSG